MSLLSPEPEPPQRNWYKIGTISIASTLLLGAIIGLSQRYSIIPKADLKIKGNKNSRIYHLPRCPNYDDISERNIRWFKSQEEAHQAGFRMAKNC